MKHLLYDCFLVILLGSTPVYCHMCFGLYNKYMATLFIISTNYFLSQYIPPSIFLATTFKFYLILNFLRKSGYFPDLLVYLE